MASCTLVFPPLWYFPAVPADLTHTGGALAARGHAVQLVDLSSRLHRSLTPGVWPRLQRADAYAELPSLGLAWRDACKAVPTAARYRPRSLDLPADPDDLVASLAVALDGRQNPALPLLQATARTLAEQAPDVVGIALVHPDQKPQAPALASLLRTAGYRGKLVLYGSLEDVLAPADFAADLVPGHALFQLFDGVICGEAESALAALLEGGPVPNLHTADHTPTTRLVEDLAVAAVPVFTGLDAADYATPTPVVDLRLGRGCPWARCSFCAIQAHQVGYRAGPAQRVADALAEAHRQLGSTHFRIRDDLVTPVQLRALAGVIGPLGLPITWMARSRFEPGLSRVVLQQAFDAGLSELWMGLESGSERVRSTMDKGVRDDVIERIMLDCAAVGIRVRALCIAGFPGETEAEYQETEAFLRRHRDRLAGFALTPFQVMRGAPMLTEPERHGLVPTEDPLPVERRLRHHVPVRGLDPDPATVQARVLRTVTEHAAWGASTGGLGPTYAWLAATLRDASAG